jgi:hypothetical protein
MTEFWYLDEEDRELGSIVAFSFRDAHAWLTFQGIHYSTVTKFRPRVRKGRSRRIERRRYSELAF